MEDFFNRMPGNSEEWITYIRNEYSRLERFLYDCPNMMLAYKSTLRDLMHHYDMICRLIDNPKCTDESLSERKYFLGTYISMVWSLHIKMYIDLDNAFISEIKRTKAYNLIKAVSDNKIQPDDKLSMIADIAVKCGMCDMVNDRAIWNGSKQLKLLAFLCGVVYCGDEVRKGDWHQDRGGRIPTNDISTFLGINRNGKRSSLSTLRCKYVDENPPEGYKDVLREYERATE